MITGLTSGCFDLFHFSHLEYLRRCKRHCERLIVGVDCDCLVKETKGSGRPIHDEMHRLDLISSLTMVDAAFIIVGLDALTRISRDFRISKVFKCEKWRDRSPIFGVTDCDAELVILPDVPGMGSTSDIIERIINSYPQLDG